MIAVIIHYGFLAAIIAVAVGCWIDQIRIELAEDTDRWQHGWSGDSFTVGDVTVYTGKHSSSTGSM